MLTALGDSYFYRSYVEVFFMSPPYLYPLRSRQQSTIFPFAGSLLCCLKLVVPVY
jgi:hypothetical protein